MAHYQRTASTMTSVGKQKPAKVERAGAEERRWRDLISAVSLLGGGHSERNSAHVPGVWLQAHHLEEEYYERFFRGGLTDAHRSHDHAWHTAE
jgi:hypothetical protein